MKPVLKYPGSKWRIAGEIVARIPEHHNTWSRSLGAEPYSSQRSRAELK